MNFDLKVLQNSDLINLRTTLEAEMKSRDLAFTVGDIGETLAIEYFCTSKNLPNLQAAPVGTKNVDALSRNGDRYSIKTRLTSKKTSAIYLDKKDPDKQLFEYILLVKINSKYELESICQFTWEQFTTHRSYDDRMSAFYLSCSKKTLNNGDHLY